MLRPSEWPWNRNWKNYFFGLFKIDSSKYSWIRFNLSVFQSTFTHFQLWTRFQLKKKVFIDYPFIYSWTGFSDPIQIKNSSYNWFSIPISSYCIRLYFHRDLAPNKTRQSQEARFCRCNRSRSSVRYPSHLRPTKLPQTQSRRKESQHCVCVAQRWVLATTR